MERIKKSVLPIIAVSGPKSPVIKDRKRPFEPPVMSPVLSTKKYATCASASEIIARTTILVNQKGVNYYTPR